MSFTHLEYISTSRKLNLGVGMCRRSSQLKIKLLFHTRKGYYTNQFLLKRLQANFNLQFVYAAVKYTSQHGYITLPLPPLPLSPYLFILALETLAIKIREDCNVQGLKIGEEMIKLSLFADDMTCVLKHKTSYTNLCRFLNSFGECSGLKVNDEKTEIMPPGDNRELKMETFSGRRQLQLDVTS